MAYKKSTSFSFCAFYVIVSLSQLATKETRDGMGRTRTGAQWEVFSEQPRSDQTVLALECSNIRLNDHALNPFGEKNGYI